jgi:hypothetical protein
MSDLIVPTALEQGPDATSYTFGLRFERKEVPKLRLWADRVKMGDATGGAELYERAADAADRGEPLIVEAAYPAEVIALAEGFVVLGLERPEIIDYNDR